MESILKIYARLSALFALGVVLTYITLWILKDLGIHQGLVFIIAPVPFIIVGLILVIFSYLTQPPKLTQELPVIRIESFPKSNGPQIAGVISRYTGMYGVDDLLHKLPVEFEVEAETSEDLKSQLQQLGCN